MSLLLFVAHVARHNFLFNLLEIGQILPNHLDLLLGILGSIVVTVEVMFSNLSELGLIDFTLRVNSIVVQTISWIITVVLQFLVLAETFQVVNRHQNLRKLSDLLKLSGRILLLLRFESFILFNIFLGHKLELGDLIVKLHSLCVHFRFVFLVIVSHLFELSFFPLELSLQVLLQTVESIMAIHDRSNSVILVAIVIADVFEELLVLLHCLPLLCDSFSFQLENGLYTVLANDFLLFLLIQQFKLCNFQIRLLHSLLVLIEV